MSDVQVRPVTRRGCGYPKPGGVYLESQGEVGGTLPMIVVIDPPIPHDHFHRGGSTLISTTCWRNDR